MTARSFNAEPYALDATGFYFKTAAEFAERSATVRTRSGEIVEEFELQFIDGDELETRIFSKMCVNQNTIADFIAAMEEWSEKDKEKVCLLLEARDNNDFSLSDDPKEIEMDIYRNMTIRDVAEEWVTEGAFGDLEEQEVKSRGYLRIDYDTIARDLAMDGFNSVALRGELVSYRVRD